MIVRWEIKYKRGCIPRATPCKLASASHSLPPILYIQYLVSISSYSKAPWGLSVLSQVTSIFTSTTISPRISLRQYPDHYAFRAGRNLPDKVFRYLRTVIVTAAVHWGLSSVLRLTTNTSPWPSSTGQASAPILNLSILQKPVFLLNSCLGLLSATYLRRLPFSLSYGVILPSSLTIFLSFAWKFSFFLPVSVYGTGAFMLLIYFSCHRL